MQLTYPTLTNTSYTLLMLDILHWKNKTMPDGNIVPVS